VSTCPDCGTQLAERLLVCPGCQRLVHAEALKQHAAEAERRTAAGDLRGALGAWREAQPLLPQGSKQAAAIAAKIDFLVREVDAGRGGAPAPAAPGDPQVAPPPGSRKGLFAGLGAALLLLWKIVPFVATKGKFLLLGLTKWTTFASMLIAFGVYWTVFGWWFAGGLVLSIYVHEMGHVLALHRLGMPASAPMFVPGLGAFIRMRSYPITPREDARVGLAGPLWGLAAALVSLGLFLVTGWAGFAAIARIGAWINLFNLMPVWQLDGSRGWRALSRVQRWVIVVAFGLAYAWLHDGLLLLIGIVAVVRSFGPGAEEPDTRAFVEFLGLVAALSALCALPVPVS
jgi:Zn-dependent protease